LLRILAGKKLAKGGKVTVNNLDPFKDYAEVPRQHYTHDCSAGSLRS
jgi:CCR4-NOT complex subunit CAF16